MRFECKAIPRVFKRYERVMVKVVGHGWMKGEKLAVARGRVSCGWDIYSKAIDICSFELEQEIKYHMQCIGCYYPYKKNNNVNR